MSEEAGATRQANPANRLAAALVLFGATSMLTWLARRVSSGGSKELDDRAREWTQARRLPWLDAATRPVTLLSMPLIVVSGTLALAAWLKREERKEGAAAVAIVPLLAAVTGQSFTTFFPQRNPPDHAGHEEPEASFPSGHTTGVTAEALTISYVLWQEDLATPVVLGALAAWPMVVGLARVYRNRHWGSDVLAGWIAGTGVAALTALLYDHVSRGSGNAGDVATAERR